MRTFVAISLIDGSDSVADELTETVNRLLCSPVSADIFIYDLSVRGAGKDIKSLCKAYLKFNVYLIRSKACENREDINFRTNIGISQSLLRFNSIKSNKYSSYLHLNQNVYFDNFDLHLLINNVGMYNVISPVIETVTGAEIYKAFFDRFGVEYIPISQSVSHFITGEIEESFAVNPKCFALSRRYANYLKNFYYCDQKPIVYINDLISSYGTTTAKVDTNIFVHENLY